MVSLHALWQRVNDGLRGCRLVAGLYLAVALAALVDRLGGDVGQLPVQHSVVNWVYVAIMVVSWIVSYAMRPDPVTPEPRKANIPVVEDGRPISVVFGDVCIDDPMELGFKQIRTTPIKAGGKK